MRRAASWGLVLGLVPLVIGSPATAQPPAAASGPAPNANSEFDALRQQCLAAAAAARQQEETVAALDHVIYLLGQDVDGRRRGLADSRPEQARLLAAIASVQRNPPGRLAFFDATPIDRVRGELLVAGTKAALRKEAQALAAEYARITVLRQEIAAKQAAVATARNALAKDRGQLRQLTALRLEMARKLLPEPTGKEARLAAFGHEASDLGDLIERADAAIARRDKELPDRTRTTPAKDKTSAAAADPTRPPEVRAFDPRQFALVPPVSAAITQRSGAEEAAQQGLRLAAASGAEVVAPFDGRITYVGPFRRLGLVLIIRHGGLYHSALTGIGRADVVPGEWVVAGEPVGAMPDAGDAASGSPLYFELRRDGRPVDPQPWLAPRAEGRDKQNGD